MSPSEAPPSPPEERAKGLADSSEDPSRYEIQSLKFIIIFLHLQREDRRSQIRDPIFRPPLPFPLAPRAEPNQRKARRNVATGRGLGCGNLCYLVGEAAGDGGRRRRVLGRRGC